jgi:2-dehydropantoate 2-reductase
VRYIIFGAGAIGSIVGGHLYRAGASVALVGPKLHMRAIRSRGLTLRTRDKTYSVPVPATMRVSDLAPFQSDDVVLLCAKTQQSVKCLSQLRTAGARRTLPILCCQNSFLNEAMATLYFDRVYGLAVYVDGIFIEPGEVIHPTGRRYGHLELGRYPSGLDHLARQVARDLSAAGFSVRVTSDVMRVKRAKFVLNMANAVIAITDQPDQAARLVKTLRAEAARVLRESGLECESFAAYRRRAEAGCGALLPPVEVASRKLIADSTWQSLYRRTGNIETPYFNGLIAQLGQSLDLPTPANSLVTELATSMAERRQRPGRFTVRELERKLSQRRGGRPA